MGRPPWNHHMIMISTFFYAAKSPPETLPAVRCPPKCGGEDSAALCCRCAGGGFAAADLAWAGIFFAGTPAELAAEGLGTGPAELAG